VLPDIIDSSGKPRRLAVGAGKDAHIYVVNRDNMGRFNPTNNNNIYQDITGALGGPEFGMPAYYNGTIYYGAAGDTIKAFPFSNGLLASTPSSQTGNMFPYPDAIPSISADTNTNAILWAAENGTIAVLYAYDADLYREFYNSNMAPEGTRYFRHRQQIYHAYYRQWESVCRYDQWRWRVWIIREVKLNGIFRVFHFLPLSPNLTKVYLVVTDAPLLPY
jgi:hypothetical protein